MNRLRLLNPMFGQPICSPVNPGSSFVERMTSMNDYLSIIMAEDDLVAQEVTMRMLKKIGLRAKVVGSGRKVLQALEVHHYDIVLMDIQMPEMGGIEATRIIRERWPIEPKIIITTNSDSRAHRELCFIAGANEFLAKPLKLEELTAAIERISHKAWMRSAWLSLRRPNFSILLMLNRSPETMLAMKFRRVCC